MTREEYLDELKSDIMELLDEPKLINYKNQAFAWKLRASFNRTFDEHYLWNRALFLSTNSCILIQNDAAIKTALQGLYESAEIYEYLSEIPEIDAKFDKDYLSILAALCYDLSGYQANAFCVARRFEKYVLTSGDTNINLSADNKIIEQIRLILLKRIPLAYHTNDDKELHNDLGYSLFKTALEQWFQNILKLNDFDYMSRFEEVYLHYLFAHNVYLSHLVFLLKTRAQLFTERGLWQRLKSNPEVANSRIWQKYAKLLAYDYYSRNSIKDINDRTSIFEFWTSQIRAIESGVIDKDENFVIQMPTSAGKTFIAELSLLKYLVKFPEKKCIYIAPFRALTNEKEIELSKYFSKLGFSVSSLSGSYEIDEFQDVFLSEADLLIATPEKIDLLLRINPDFFNSVSFAVIDEGHIIGDISTRATLLEFLIVRLRIKVPDIRTLFISAVMPPANADEYSLWLSNKEGNVLRSLKYSDSNVTEEWEPTRKLIGYFEWSGDKGDIIFDNVTTEDEETHIRDGAKLYSYLRHREFGQRYPQKKDKKETAAALAFKMSEEGNTLVFCAQVPRINSVAKAFLSLLDSVDELPDWFLERNDKKSSYYANIWYGEDSYVTKSINRGIGIHYGDMPEQVRTAVEDDFRNGKLKVLLSTNTIGQGLNFPIKNLIFYETQIGRDENKEGDKNIYIQKRDFWNIVGRAGRAGKETEGKIIFIVNTPTDKRLYKGFIDKSKIEPANSLIFHVLDLLSKNKLTEEAFFGHLSLLSETYLLDMMTEEVIGTDYEQVISDIINNSLFKVQVEKRGMDIAPIKQGFGRIFKSFEEEESIDQLSTYRVTGFSFRTNQIIDDFIQENIDALREAVAFDDYIAVIRLFIRLIFENELSELKDEKLDKLNLSPDLCLNVVENWIKGEAIKDLIIRWQNSFGGENTQLHIFISKALYYLYPWGFSAFLMILASRLDIEFKTLPENIKNTSSYLKYGVNNPTSCLARSLGIRSRQVSLYLYEKSERKEGHEFIVWVSNLAYEEIESFEISNFDKENLLDVSLTLTPKSYRTEFKEYNFSVKGISYNPQWSIISMQIKPSDKLRCVRDEHNGSDPYAVLIYKNDSPLGYVPREYAKIISPEMDIEDAEYLIHVQQVIPQDGYNEINVSMTKIWK